MNIEYIRAKIKEVSDVAHDPESAHIKEDELMSEVLAAIASEPMTKSNMRELANEVLKVNDLLFERWCA